MAVFTLLSRFVAALFPPSEPLSHGGKTREPGAFGYSFNRTTVNVSFVSPSGDLKTLPSTYIACDLETTGFVPGTAEIIELGAARFVEGRKMDTFSSFVRPTRRVPREITRITGITQEMVRNAPTAPQVLRDFLAWSDGEMLVAHNARFEAGFFAEHLGRHSIAGSLTFLCTCNLARGNFSLPNYKLRTVADRFDVPLVNAHRALPDAEACGEVAYRMVKEILAEEEVLRANDAEKQRRHAERQAKAAERTAKKANEEARRLREEEIITHLKEMCSAVLADGELTVEECEMLSGWLSAEGKELTRRPFKTLRDRLTKVLEDNKLVAKEVQGIRASIETIIQSTSAA